MGHLGPKCGQNEVLGHFLGYYPKMGHLGTKMGQGEVLGHFLGYYAFGFGDFAYYD